MSVEIAEVVGIHFGDGTMEDGRRGQSFTYKVAYALDSRRPAYVEFVEKVFLQSLGVRLRRIEDASRHCTVLYFYSKELCEFFNKTLKIPYGRKCDLRIPDYLLTDKNYIASFLRGLFDTDGCYTMQRSGKYSYELLKFTTKHKSFALDVQHALEVLDIQAYICRKAAGHDVVIRNVQSQKVFYSMVKPRKEKMGPTGFEPGFSANT
jgi:hypothetical protein